MIYFAFYRSYVVMLTREVNVVRIAPDGGEAIWRKPRGVSSRVVVVMSLTMYLIKKIIIELVGKPAVMGLMDAGKGFLATTRGKRWCEKEDTC
ncbi:hypothetical protein V6N13_049375 [Hibiscus sabdariffa]|uniref:Uncharacterized protein n=1 Tax=Hibiscus sabdariffa TaxID=183260 RepID=A0ABR2QXQ7_9ROSI